MGENGGTDPVWMTTAMIKAYAHPLRRRMLRLFTDREFLRAADVAAVLDVPANSASFHLRVLADAGLIDEAPEQARDRRDRVWKIRRMAVSVGSPDHPAPDEALGVAMLHLVGEEHQDLLRRVLAWTPEYVSGRTREVHAEFMRTSIRLTESELTTLTDRIRAVIAEVGEAHDNTDPDGRVWQLDLLAGDDRI